MALMSLLLPLHQLLLLPHNSHLLFLQHLKLIHPINIIVIIAIIITFMIHSYIYNIPGISDVSTTSSSSSSFGDVTNVEAIELPQVPAALVAPRADVITVLEHLLLALPVLELHLPLLQRDHLLLLHDGEVLGGLLFARGYGIRGNGDE